MIKNKISKLKKYFLKYQIDGYVIPKNDEFFSEFDQFDRLNKISNFRKTFNELFQFIKKKNVDEKKLLTSLNRMNFFRNESNLLNSLDLFQKLKIISSQRIKNWKSLLKELKKVKVKVSGLEAEEIKEKIFHERLKVIQDKKNDL